MWLLIRLAALLIGFFWKRLGKLFPPSPKGTFEGHSYFEKISKNKQGRVTRLRLGADLNSPVLFRLSRETKIDLFFKSVGLSTEFQTGDKQFDQMIYIACDHPFLYGILRQDENARKAILDILQNKFRAIFCDGNHLWIESTYHQSVTQKELELLAALRKALSPLRSGLPHRWTDPFYRKAFLVEGFITSLGGFAFASYLEGSVNRQDYHLQQFPLACSGAFCALAVAVLLIAGIAWLFSGSSRGHRIVIESGVLLLIALPFVGIQLVSDINRELDRGPDNIVTRQIADVRKREHRGRRGRRWYSYHLFLEPAPRDLTSELPREIEISSSLFNRLRKGQTVQFTIAPGFLGHAWYRDIQPVNAPNASNW
jgi:hypothetical protein